MDQTLSKLVCERGARMNHEVGLDAVVVATGVEVA